MNAEGTATQALLARARTFVSSSIWAPEEPERSLARRVRSATWVALVWLAVLAPSMAGWQRCPVAAVLHEPCPGCGVTRAIKLLWDGHADASIQMHPFAVPALVSGMLVVLATVWATVFVGSPVRLFRTRFGSSAVAIAVVVYAAMFTLWILRAFGYCGGPVPV